jgi:hypothetical protein
VAKIPGCSADGGIQQYAHILLDHNLIDQTKLNEIVRYSNATFYVEWFDGQPNNDELAWALDDTGTLIDSITALKSS